MSRYFGCKYDENNGMFSEHLIILSCLSASNHNINKILEIGTHDGRCALILANLFPDASIMTIDLPANSDDFKDTYGRTDNYNSFVRKRENNISSNKNIIFEEMNSLKLYDYQNKFDLIWVDGAHGYPIIACDIINSLRIINDNGFVLIDDAYKSVSKSDNWYQSIGAYETLVTLSNINLIKFSLFYKRLSCNHNQSWNRKFVSIFQKT